MIKANELRKGVLIIDYTGIEREVYGEDIQQQCWHEEGQSGTTEAPLNPIPLTPEWLGRCGLPNDLSTLDAGGNYSLIFERRSDKLFLVSSSAMESEVIRQIEFVHHLQNIYLDLTGEELQIKP